MDQSEKGAGSQIQRVADLQDPALDVYRHLKDKHLRCREGLFIAEGLEVVRRLCRSDHEVSSLLLTPGKYARLQADIPAGVPVHLAEQAQMEAIAGFTIHRGAVACGVRPAQRTLQQTLAAVQGMRMVVVLEGVSDAQNVGVVIRNAAAFGAGLVVLHRCCDPYYRRAVRVSMGNVFAVPLLFSENLPADLSVLKTELGLELVAAELSPEAIPLWDAPRPRRVGLCFGAEGEGLSEDVIRACDHRVVVPMRPESDSVNLAVASGIFLYAYSASSATGSTQTFGSAKGDAATDA